jgi:hypothetical protein
MLILLYVAIVVVGGDAVAVVANSVDADVALHL